MKRPRRVLEIGCGLGAQKAIAIAGDHRNWEVHAVDKEASEQHKIIAQGVGRANLPNLRVVKGKSAEVFLREVMEREKKPIYDHAYAHWVLSCMGRQTRLNVFRELLRNIKPGSKWSIVDEEFIEEQIPQELRSVGFKVSVKRIGFDQLIKNFPDFQDALRNNPMRLLRIGSGTLTNYMLRANFAKEYDYLKRTQGDRAALKLLKEDRRVTRRRLESYESTQPTRESDEAIRRMVWHRNSDLKKPFVVITATKPK